MIPEQTIQAIECALDVQAGRATAVSGGDINQAARLETNQGPVFVKWKADAPPGFFEAEADGLRRLRAANALRVPDVLWVGNTGLALEYIKPEVPRDQTRFTRRFAQGLAALHRNLSHTNQYGLETNNVIGALPQVNDWRATWPAFYRDCRLAPQIALARRLSRLTPERERSLMQLLEDCETLLDYTSAPSLIHGDLWSGNFLAAGDEAVVIDPAVSYSDREVEIAYIALFGGFPQNFIAQYQDVFPLERGHERRRSLYQLYYLLAHLNLFGEAYGPQIDAICRAYV